MRLRPLFPRLSSYSVYLILSGATAFFFTVFGTLSSVYRIQTAGLNPFQLVLIGTVLELSVFTFEVPTGVVADLYSRRRSVIIGMFLIGAGFVLEGLFPIFATMLLAQVIWGVGATFESGAKKPGLPTNSAQSGSARHFSGLCRSDNSPHLWVSL